MPSEAFLSARAAHLREIGREDLIDAPPLVLYDERGDFDPRASKWARADYELAQFDKANAA